MGDERNLEAFIPSVLDDAGLSPAEFRVFCRIKRRGECTEGVPKMALGCKLHPDTIWEALSRLVDLNMITRTPRPGASTIFRTLPPADWKIPTGKGGAAEKEGRPSKPVTPHRKRGGDYPPEKKGHKGNPIEGNPIKAIPLNRPVASNLDGASPTIKGQRIVELMERCRTIFGDVEMKRPDCHRRWLDRATTDWGKLVSVLNDTAAEMKERGLTNPAAWAEKMWQDFASRN